MKREVPPEDEEKDFKSRIRWLVAQSKEAPAWWEKRPDPLTGKPLGRGQVDTWQNPEHQRGRNVGVTKAKQAARIFGVHWQWLLDGELVNGARFLDDPMVDPAIERVTRLETRFDELASRIQPPKGDAGAGAGSRSKRHLASVPPAKMAERDGPKRPR